MAAEGRVADYRRTERSVTIWGMLRILNRRPVGWLVVGIVASVVFLMALTGVAAALAQSAFGAAAWGFLWLLFWYWIAEGALRRTYEPSPGSTQQSPTG
jgi:high-affinity Fe2+/Pb2+ permease